MLDFINYPQYACTCTNETVDTRSCVVPLVAGHIMESHMPFLGIDDLSTNCTITTVAVSTTCGVRRQWTFHICAVHSLRFTVPGSRLPTFHMCTKFACRLCFHSGLCAIYGYPIFLFNFCFMFKRCFAKVWIAQVFGTASALLQILW